MFLIALPSLVCAQALAADKQTNPTPAQQSQQSGTTATSADQSGSATPSKPQSPPVTPPAQSATPPDQDKDSSEGKQTNRILWIVPNFTAVSANTKLPPLSAREKFTISMHDSVDYTSFVWAGILAAQSMALKTYPELGQEASGYGRYYWRAFADQASGAFFTEGLVPALTREDPRYYTLGHGNFFRRAGYALSQVVLTKTDHGGDKERFNISEILGNGLEAGLANAYYPPQERGLHSTAVNWATGIESAALNNLVKEFWPDIRQKLLRQK